MGGGEGEPDDEDEEERRERPCSVRRRGSEREGSYTVSAVVIRSTGRPWSEMASPPSWSSSSS